MGKSVIDEIVLKDGRTLNGVVDYVTKKYIYFFDFTTEKVIDYYTLAVIARGNSNLRFSVYCSIAFPTIELPRAIVFNRKDITDTSHSLEVLKPNKVSRRTHVIT